jgi:hypothetical protein
MLEFSFDIGDLTIQIRTDEHLIYQFVEEWFGQQRGTTRGTTQARFLIQDAGGPHADQCDPRLLQFHRTAALSDGHAYRSLPDGLLYRDKFASWLLRDNDCHCLFKMQQWLADGFGYHPFYYFVWRTMFLEGLWQRERFWLHAAAIGHRTLGSILVVGNSNHGKSTISMAFCEVGHRLLTDDSVVFSPGHSEFHALQRDCQLDRTLGARIATLQGIEKNKPFAATSFKVPVRIDDYYPDASVEKLSGVDAIVFPMIIESQQTAIEPLGSFEAFWRLLCHAYSGLWDPTGRITDRILRSFAGMVANAPAFALFCGEDAYERPSLCVDFIESALQ